MERVEVCCLGLLAAVFAAVAAVGFFLPHVLFDPIGVPLDSAAAAAEIRAGYGGLFGAVSYVCAMGALRPPRRTQALTVAVIALGGFTVGRLLSWGLDGAPENPIAVANLIAEGVGFTVAALLLFARRRRAHGPTV